MRDPNGRGNGRSKEGLPVICQSVHVDEIAASSRRGIFRRDERAGFLAVAPGHLRRKEPPEAIRADRTPDAAFVERFAHVRHASVQYVHERSFDAPNRFQ